MSEINLAKLPTNHIGTIFKYGIGGREEFLNIINQPTEHIEAALGLKELELTLDEVEYGYLDFSTFFLETHASVLYDEDTEAYHIFTFDEVEVFYTKLQDLIDKLNLNV